jgi:hypothetical protein
VGTLLAIDSLGEEILRFKADAGLVFKMPDIEAFTRV